MDYNEKEFFRATRAHILKGITLFEDQTANPKFIHNSLSLTALDKGSLLIHRDSQVEQENFEVSQIRSSSLNNRQNEHGVRYKHGHMRLVEYDKHVNSSMSGSEDFRVRLSFMDDPNLEININQSGQINLNQQRYSKHKSSSLLLDDD